MMVLCTAHPARGKPAESITTPHNHCSSFQTRAAHPVLRRASLPSSKGKLAGSLFNIQMVPRTAENNFLSQTVSLLQYRPGFHGGCWDGGDGEKALNVSAFMETRGVSFPERNIHLRDCPRPREGSDPVPETLPSASG